MIQSQPPTAPPGQLRRRLLWSLGALLLGLASAESFARLRREAHASPTVRGGVHRDTKDPEQLFENRPGGRLVVEYPGNGDLPAWTVEHVINEAGFRGPVIPMERRPGSFRIACLGDSHTFGHGVDSVNTWPALLEGELRRRSPALEIECLNAGVDGYDPHQEVIWLKRRVLPYKPDLVLLQLHMNDAASRGQAKRKEQPPRLFQLSHPERGPAWIRRLRSASKAVDSALAFVHASQQIYVYRESMTVLYRQDAEGWQRAQKALLEMRELLAKRRVPFAVVFYPSLFRLDEELISNEAFGYWSEFLDANGIAYLDPRAAFDQADLSRLRVHPHDFHGNAAANEIFATEVCRWIGRRDDLR